jgi:hypothetical protein
MVSDAIRKIVFLSVPVSVGSFPLRKDIFYGFFTVKQIFPNIKWWAVGEPNGNPAWRAAKQALCGTETGHGPLVRQIAEEKK